MFAYLPEYQVALVQGYVIYTTTCSVEECNGDRGIILHVKDNKRLEATISIVIYSCLLAFEKEPFIQNALYLTNLLNFNVN